MSQRSTFLHCFLFQMKIWSVEAWNRIDVERGRSLSWKSLVEQLKVFVLASKCFRSLHQHTATSWDSIIIIRYLVQTILICNCQIWGFESLNVIEKVHLWFCKILLKLKSLTPNCMVYGELGRYQLIVHVHSRMINYWAKSYQG